MISVDSFAHLPIRARKIANEKCVQRNSVGAMHFCGVEGKMR